MISTAYVILSVGGVFLVLTILSVIVLVVCLTDGGVEFERAGDIAFSVGRVSIVGAIAALIIGGVLFSVMS